MENKLTEVEKCLMNTFLQEEIAEDDSFDEE